MPMEWLLLGKAGERTPITETDQQGVETNITYEYDKLNRLVTETIEKQGNKLTNDYTYDKVSNRTAKETTVAEIDKIGIDTLSGLSSIGNSVYYRDKKRKAPHNAYTSSAGIKKGIELSKYETLLH